MQITSLVDILDGELLGCPAISFVYDFKMSAAQIKDGEAFLGNNPNDIAKAISNGAFCIIFSNEGIDPSDDLDVAWIKVKDVNIAVAKIIRFLISTYKLKSLYCNKLTFNMLYIYKKLNPKVVFLDENISKWFGIVKNIKQNSIVVSSNQAYLELIIPNTKLLKAGSYRIKNIIEHSLFEVSFSYRDNFFTRLKLPTIYLKNFIEVFEFYGHKNIDFSRLKKFKYLNPIFLNKNSEIIEFGKSDKFVITQNDKSSFLMEINYINSRFKYGKKIFLLPNNMRHTIDIDIDNTIFYHSKEEIKQILNHSYYNCLYIFGIDSLKLESILEHNYETKSLF